MDKKEKFMDYEKGYIDLRNVIHFAIYLLKHNYNIDEIIAILEKIQFESLNE